MASNMADNDDGTLSLLTKFDGHDEEQEPAAVSPDAVSAFSNRINAILQKAPSKESLCAILKMSFPEMSEQNSSDAAFVHMARSEVIHQLKKEAAYSAKSIRVLDDYMRKCCEAFLKPHTSPDPMLMQPTVPPQGPPPDSSLPVNFHVTLKWPFLNIDIIHPNHECRDRHFMEALAALHCMNARGTIAHEQYLETTPFTWNTHKNLSAVDMFVKFGGGIKRFTSQREIQRDIMANGPVVSLSFVPPTLYPMACHPAKFIPAKDDPPEKHAVLIIGWEFRGGGWYWLVKRVPDGTQDNTNIKPLKVPIRQCHMEDECIAPVSSFDNICWQRGPYYDRSNLPAGWIHGRSFKMTVGEEEAEKLAKEYGIRQAQPLVMRDVNRLAHSRRYVLDSMSFIAEWCAWTLKFSKVG